MSLSTATISGTFVRPDAGVASMTAYIEAASVNSMLTASGSVILSKVPVKIQSDGSASVTIWQLPQAGISPSDARWRLVMESGANRYTKEFNLTGDTSWNALVDVSGVPITSSLLQQAAAARDAALAAVASVAVSTWQPTTSYVSGQTVQAPDGSQIKSNSTRTSRASFDITEQTNWTVVFAVNGTMARAALEPIVESWVRAPRVEDLTYPIVIAHRGASDQFGQNTVSAYRGASALGSQAIEAGDVQALADGTLVTVHDGTVDSTMTGTGNVSSFTKTTWLAMSHDFAQVAWGGSYTLDPAPLWDDALAALAGKAVIFPEVKDTLNSTATAMCDRLDALGARESAVITSFNIANLVIAAGRGYKTMFVTATATTVLNSIATLVSDGIWSVGLDHAQADVTPANIATIQAAGFRVFLYTVDHRSQAAAAQALAADGYYSNATRDYILGNTAAYRKTFTSFHLSGRWEPGMAGQGDGPYDGSSRGSLIGAPGAYRLKVGATSGGVAFGQLCPVVNAAGSYTITVGCAIDTIPTTTTQGPAFYFALPDDSLTGGSNLWSGYEFKLRANGGTQLWSLGSAGAVTSLGTATCTAFQRLTLTSALTGGTAYTTLAVSALTVAVKVGHQFMLLNGQIVTIATAAAIGATSLTIQSITPAATVASGSFLIPYVTMLITVSPTTITAQRGDETSVAAISAANTDWRGAYLAASPASEYSTGAVSYHKVTVS